MDLNSIQEYKQKVVVRQSIYKTSFNELDENTSITIPATQPFKKSTDIPGETGRNRVRVSVLWNVRD